MLLTQTLHLVFDFPAALCTIDRALRPGGVLLLTVPGITPIDSGEWGSSWHCSFSHHALARMCDEFPDGAEVAIASYGNALSAVAFLHGLSARELTRDELDQHEVTHSILNVRASEEASRRGLTRWSVEAVGVSGSSGHLSHQPDISCR